MESNRNHIQSRHLVWQAGERPAGYKGGEYDLDAWQRYQRDMAHLENFYITSQDRHVHRCKVCWATSLHKDTDNGFIGVGIDYQHDPACPHVGLPRQYVGWLVSWGVPQHTPKAAK